MTPRVSEDNHSPPSRINNIIDASAGLIGNVQVLPRPEMRMQYLHETLVVAVVRYQGLKGEEKALLDRDGLSTSCIAIRHLANDMAKFAIVKMQSQGN